MIQKSAYLACPPEKAFALFTERASDWWPHDVRHTADPRSEITMLANGRFWERATDGHEVELGRVLVWEPARRLILDFYPGTDAQHPTEVVIRFTAENGGTRVDVEHSAKLESADLWATGAPKFERSWTLVLAALRAASANDDL
ncbi:MAG: SRPBCC domain-containing protein [Actinomycetota bacterium]|nr:SRPBCC domain-containing protein [Actinomycetota bacterium]